MSEENHKPHNRLHALDGLRATMMLLGLVLHTAVSYTVQPIGNAWPYQDPHTTTIFADYTVGLIHVFRMPIFFVLAGFFSALLYIKRGGSGFINNRIQRILIPFAIGLLILAPMINSGFTFTNVTSSTSLTDGWNVVKDLFSNFSFYLPNSTMHLWFIYYLVYFYLVFILLIQPCKVLPKAFKDTFLNAFARMTAHPVLRVIIPALMTALTLLPMQGTLRTSTQFTPDPDVLIAYGVFFGFGWLLYSYKELLGSFDRYALSQTIAGFVIYLVSIMFIIPALAGGDGNSSALFIQSLIGGLVVWLLFYGITGLFLRYLNNPSPYVRYAVDASYWVYLLHLPIIIWIPGFLVATSLSVWAKMLIVSGLTTLIGFITYDLFVRSTFIGKALNGRRYPRGLPPAE